MPLQPLTCQLFEKPWGRDDLAHGFADGTKRIGEAWYLHPALDLPLLVKWIFTSERLSIQVHPDDIQARASGFLAGKDEWWFVTSASKGATLGLGTTRTLSPAELLHAAGDGSLEHLMNWVPVQAGDWFHIPPGTIHAIGAGIELVEIQQNSDVTYRLYDYGRPRELHLDAGVAASDARPFPHNRQGNVRSAQGNLPVRLIVERHFAIWYGQDDMIGDLPADKGWVIPLTGQIDIGTGCFAAGAVLFGDLKSHARTSAGFSFLAVQSRTDP